MFLFVVGGNRKHEDEPLRSIILYSKKLNLDLIIVTDKIHLLKECKNFKNLKELLREYKTKYYLFKNINTEFKRLNKLVKSKNSYLLAVNSIWIFKKKIIDLFKNRIFNLHIGKLPSQKGAGGASWQILSKDKSSAATIHEINNKIDEGKIFIEELFNINSSTTLIKYYKTANLAEKKILKQFLKIICTKKKIKLKKASQDYPIYMPRLDTSVHGFINWEWSTINILNFIKAFDEPYIGASTFYKGKLVHLKEPEIIYKGKVFHPFQSGIIVRKTNKFICVATCNGIIKVTKLTDSKGKLLNIKIIKIGERFYTPITFLENAKQKRAFHTGRGVKIKYA